MKSAGLRLSFLPLSLVALVALSSQALSDVITKPDGLKIEDTRAVECDRPTKAGDIISVHYRGTLTDGVQFDESWDRGQPFVFKLGGREVIDGWDEGLLDMCIGTRRRLTIPPELGYGVRGSGIIPSNAVLIFETQLMGIKGVPSPSPPPKEEPTPAVEESHEDVKEVLHEDIEEEDPAALPADPTESSGQTQDHGPPDAHGPEGGPEDSPPECRLLGPFALVVQAALGVLALMSLVFKRWREHPRRPLKVWFFDASKQVAGTALLHVANLAMSMFSSNVNIAANIKGTQVAKSNMVDHGRGPNPCSFYLLNLAIDTTIGIPILVILLKVLHAAFQRTPLANPPESLKSGHYGNPPHPSWWVKQSFIYFLGLFGMKLFVLFLFAALPWLPWVGDWALRWTEGDESLQIAFVMFLFPLAMNAIQYYIIDAFIMEKKGEEGYQSVESEERDAYSGEGDRPVRDENGDDDDEDEDKDKTVSDGQ